MACQENAASINIVQKTGSALYRSVSRAVFRGTGIHFRKFGQTTSLEDKKASTGIIYHAKTDTVGFRGMELKLKPVREHDHYFMEAMQHRVKYCRIVRRPYGNGDRFFLQIVMEGSAPKKITPGSGVMGLDRGVSTMAAVTGGSAEFLTLADGVEHYDKKIKQASAVYERRRRLANPQNYNTDGTIRRDTEDFRKTWKRTKGTAMALQRLRAAYEKRSAFIRNSHGYQTNRLVESCGTMVTEPMDYRALTRQAKGLSRQDRESAVRTKSGKTRTVRKFRRRRRFGASVLRRSPGAFSDMLARKMGRYGGLVIEVSLEEYRASQYDHVTGEYRKPALSDRTKLIGGHRVQRDLYSAYLLKNIATLEKPDRKACADGFKNFLRNQGKTVARIIRTGDRTKNFGLADFLAA